MWKALILAGLMSVAVAGAGCNMLEVIEDSPTTSYLVVQQSTLRYIGDDPEKAERVLKVASDVETSLSGTVTVSLLDNYIRAQVKWDKLSLADAALLDSLLVRLAARMEEKVGAGELGPEELVSVSMVIQWIKESAAFAMAYHG